MKVRTIRLTRGVIRSVLAVTILLPRISEVERNPRPDDHADKIYVTRSHQMSLNSQPAYCATGKSSQWGSIWVFSDFCEIKALNFGVFALICSEKLNKYV